MELGGATANQHELDVMFDQRFDDPVRLEPNLGLIVGCHQRRDDRASWS